MITVEANALIEKLRTAQKALMPQSPEVAKAYTRIGMLTQSAIIESILQWRSQGHLYKRGMLINSIKYDVLEDGVKVYSAGVPYARIHEFGTIGKGGKLPDIVPKRRKWLTIPLEREYERVRPRSLNLEFVQDDTGKAWLWDLRKQRVAYRLLKRVSIPARPYFYPAVEKTTARRLEILRGIFAVWGDK